MLPRKALDLLPDIGREFMEFIGSACWRRFPMPFVISQLYIDLAGEGWRQPRHLTQIFRRRSLPAGLPIADTAACNLQRMSEFLLSQIKAATYPSCQTS